MIGLVVLMELAGFGVTGFGVVGFGGGARSLEMKREVKMKQRSSNGNNSASSGCDNAQAKEAHNFI